VDAINQEELRTLREAAERGEASAQTTLGLAYELGHGVECDPLYASHLYRQAALAGESRAQYALGLLYEQGTWEVSPRLARRWYELAAERGHVAARRRLDSLGGAPDGRAGVVSPMPLNAG
jgi:TPR repeat protein